MHSLLTVADLVALGYSRTFAFGLIAANRGTKAVEWTERPDARGTLRRVEALRVPVVAAAMGEAEAVAVMA